MEQKPVIVSRHPAAIEFIRRQVVGASDFPVIPIATAEDVRDAVVFGNLPLHLAAIAKKVNVIEFTGEPPRGQEYSIEDMDAAGAVIRSYRVQYLVLASVI